MTTAAPRGPLTGLRVIDIGTMIAGPFAATLLADFGAEVIKVEIPGRGDTLRHIGPTRGETSYWFAADARNKQSITLDLRRPAGRELLLRLVAVADALVENFVPGTLDGWGLDAATLREVNPRLVIGRASGYGQTGPYRTRPGYDRVGFAFGGGWHLTGEPDGEPIRPGISMTDYLTGTFNALGVMIALYHRDVFGGPGQDVDAALYESVFRTMEFSAVQYALDGIVRNRVGNRGPSVPAGAFLTRDGAWIMVAVAEDKMYQRVMRAIGRDDLAGDLRYRTAPGRLADHTPIEDAIRDWILCHDKDEALRILEAADIPAAAATTMADAFADPQYAARGTIAAVDDAVLGPLQMQGVTPKLSATPGGIHHGAPRLGEHTATVYRDLLGLTPEEIARLQADGVV